MKVLVINAWSSSLKYQVFEMPQKETLAKGLVEKIGLDMWIVNYKAKWEKLKLEMPIPNHKVALKEAFKLLTEWDTAVLRNIAEIDAVWHRVVHGWEKFSNSVIITDNILKEIEACIEMDMPLEINLGGARWIMLATMDDILGYHLDVEYLYPFSKFWELVGTYKDAKVVIGIDAHKPDQITKSGIELAEKYIKDYQLNLIDAKTLFKR